MEFLGKFYSLSQQISIYSDIERPRHFDHFGTVLNLAMCSVDNPKISLWEGRYKVFGCLLPLSKPDSRM